MYQLVIAFIYDSIMMFLTLKQKKPVHPLVPLIVDLLIWVALVAAVTYAAGLGLFEFWNPFYEEFAEPGLWQTLRQAGSLELAGVVFACFVW